MLVVMVGLPGSGKSTWAAENFRHIVSPDRIRLDELGLAFDRAGEKRVRSLARTRVREHLADGRVVCFDATSVTRKRRAVLGRMAEGAGVPAIAVWMRVPEEVAWERNLSRERPVPQASFEQLAEAFQPPTTAEGFDAVVVISPDGAGGGPGTETHIDGGEG
jgi:predicted kinase